jgi:hypothetical protein
VSNIIPMPNRTGSGSKLEEFRERRYTVRYPFASDVELIDLDSGSRAEGVTSDLSLGGCFVCTSRPLPMGARARMKLNRRGQTLEALVVVRIVKPRIGMGIEFIDIEPPYTEVLAGWIEQLRRSR